MVKVDHAAILAVPSLSGKRGIKRHQAASSEFSGESAPTADVGVKVLGQACGAPLPFTGPR